MLAAILINFCLFCAVIYNSSFLMQRSADFINDITNFGDSPYGQLAKASLIAWYDYGFFTGVGVGQFRNICPIIMLSYDVTYCDLHSHNIYLEVLSETGIIGLGIFIMFVFYCLHSLVRAIIFTTDLQIISLSSFSLASLFVVLLPFSITMSFFDNWAGVLNWFSISLSMSIIKLHSTRKY